MVMKSEKSSDAVMRIEAKIQLADKDPGSAIEKLMLIKRLEKSDLDLFGSVISDIKMSELEDAQKVIDFYEKAINKRGGKSEDYIRLADILYDNNRKDHALKYYKKGVGDEWAMYRIGIIEGKADAETVFGNLQKGNSTLSRVAKVKLMEMSVLDRVTEVF